MGSALSSNARQLARSVAPQRKLEPFSPAEIEALNRMAEKDQARMRDLPTLEELNAKDGTLDNLLSKLGGSIAGRDLSPEGPVEASTSGRGPQMPPARPPQVRRAVDAAVWRSVQSADDQPGRLQSYLLREILEARTAAAAEGKELDLEPYVRTYGADRAKLQRLMDFNCLPLVGKVPVFGHQYAFARAPRWWLREGELSGSQFRSEPDELRRRLMGGPVGPPGAPSAMFRSGGSGGKEQADGEAAGGKGEGAGEGRAAGAAASSSS